MTTTITTLDSSSSYPQVASGEVFEDIFVDHLQQEDLSETLQRNFEEYSPQIRGSSWPSSTTTTTTTSVDLALAYYNFVKAYKAGRANLARDMRPPLAIWCFFLVLLQFSLI